MVSCHGSVSQLVSWLGNKLWPFGDRVSQVTEATVVARAQPKHQQWQRGGQRRDCVSVSYAVKKKIFTPLITVMKLVIEFSLVQDNFADV